MFSLRAPSTLLRHGARAFTTSVPRSSMAKISIIGHLAATPEVQATSTGHELIKYAVATNSGPKENQTTSWWNVASFAPEGTGTRELLTRLPKGTLVYVEGDATMRTYEDREGKSRSALNITQRR
jgi:single-stranded DNA-binding protein